MEGFTEFPELEEDKFGVFWYTGLSLLLGGNRTGGSGGGGRLEVSAAPPWLLDPCTWAVIVRLLQKEKKNSWNQNIFQCKIKKLVKSPFGRFGTIFLFLWRISKTTGFTNHVDPSIHFGTSVNGQEIDPCRGVDAEHIFVVAFSIYQAMFHL